MDEHLLQHLKQRHRFGSWCGRNTLNENLFFWQFHLNAYEVAGWQPARIQHIEPQPVEPQPTAERTTGGRAVAATTELAAAPRLYPACTQSIWQCPEYSGASFLNVTSFECASREAAHDLLLRLLTQFESPLVERQEESTIGDVTFAGSGEAAVLFARANLVHLIRNAGISSIRVTDMARQFDQDLIDKPKTEATDSAPVARRTGRRSRAAAIKTRLGDDVPLDVESTAPPGVRAAALEAGGSSGSTPAQPMMYKIFSPAGEVFRDGGLIYHPASTGTQAVTVFSVDANRAVARRQLQFVVE